MRLFVLGATGRTGREILDLGLVRGHQITALARSPQKLEPARGLTIVAGDPRSTTALREAMRDHDAVLSAIGPGLRDSFRPSTLLTDVAASTVAAMTTTGVPRLGIVSAALLFPDSSVRFAFFRWLASHHIRDLATMEAVVTASDVAWTIARPPRLVTTPQESYRAERDELPSASYSTSFRSVAAFLLDSVEERKHVRQIVGVTR